MSKKQNLATECVNALMKFGKSAVSADEHMASTKEAYIRALESGQYSHDDVAALLDKKKDSDSKQKAVAALTKIRASLNNEQRSEILTKAQAASSSEGDESEWTADTIGLPKKREVKDQSGQGAVISFCDHLIAYLHLVFKNEDKQAVWDLDSHDDDGNPIVLDENDKPYTLTLDAIFKTAFTSRFNGEASLMEQLTNTKLKLNDRIAVVNKMTRGVADCLKGTNGKRRDVWAAATKALSEAVKKQAKADKEADKREEIQSKAKEILGNIATKDLKSMFTHAENLLEQEGFEKMPKPRDKRIEKLLANENVAKDLSKGPRSEILKAMKSAA